jgi:hypothetical protein
VDGSAAENLHGKMGRAIERRESQAELLIVSREIQRRRGLSYRTSSWLIEVWLDLEIAHPGAASIQSHCRTTRDPRLRTTFIIIPSLAVSAFEIVVLHNQPSITRLGKSLPVDTPG